MPRAFSKLFETSRNRAGRVSTRPLAETRHPRPKFRTFATAGGRRDTGRPTLRRLGDSPPRNRQALHDLDALAGKDRKVRMPLEHPGGRLMRVGAHDYVSRHRVLEVRNALRRRAFRFSQRPTGRRSTPGGRPSSLPMHPGRISCNGIRMHMHVGANCSRVGRNASMRCTHVLRHDPPSVLQVPRCYPRRGECTRAEGGSCHVLRRELLPEMGSKQSAAAREVRACSRAREAEAARPAGPGTHRGG